MFGILTRYTKWLHTQWPAGTVERLPEVRSDGSTNLPGVYISGDLTGIPLLKFSLDTGARAVGAIADDTGFQNARSAKPEVLDLIIIGAGVSGMAAAMEARRRELTHCILEVTEEFSTLANFPRGKPIFTYPEQMHPAGELQVSADTKETLIEELEQQVTAADIHVTQGRAEKISRSGGILTVHLADQENLRALRVIIAIGRSGNYRHLGVPGEDLDKVYNRLHDPRDFCEKNVLVVGGGDSALETAIAIAQCGGEVTLSYRGKELSRPKPGNIEKLKRLAESPGARGAVALRLGTRIERINDDSVVLTTGDGGSETVPNDVVFTMIGRETPLDFFRRSGIRIAGEMTPRRWIMMGLFLTFCGWLYNWKSGGAMSRLWQTQDWFPFNLPGWLSSLGSSVAASAQDPSTLLGTLAISATGPAFWYTIVYSIIVVVFGLKRIKRRKTPYITAQTLTLMAVQVFPLFLIPEVILPLLFHNGLLPSVLADALFPAVTYGHGREFWRAYGFILAWPLNVYNIFTHEPLWWWIGIGFLQTVVLIPLGIYFWGKGVYCGWICSCGALAETLGDTHRTKMPHGPSWNRFNMAGQVVLAIAVILLILRIIGWVLPQGNGIDRIFDPVLKEQYKWVVDVSLAGVVGYGVYFWYSGRFWCRFLCPLAALMHIYARFSRFRILSDKKKCISCNVCTTVCHQGIDVMSFANKGTPMDDPECVRCSACVQSCPTGVLTFGQVNKDGKTIRLDAIPASPVQMRENGS